MPFDLATAQPVKKAGGFDLATAKPSRNPKVAATEQRRKAQVSEHEATMAADQAENEASLGGIVHGTLQGLSELNPLDAATQYVKDYGGGIATALENAQDTGPMDAVTGLVAPILEYPASMLAGAVSAPFRSGDYRTEQQAAFNALNETLPEGAKRSQEAVGSVLKPVGDLIQTAEGGLREGAIAAGVPEGIAKNVTAVGSDIAQFATAKKAAPKGTPVLKPGPPKRAPVTPGVTADPLARARDAGYTIPASARTAEGKPASRIGSAVEGVSGRASGQARADQLNDQRVLVGIRKDLGLPKNAAITKPAINAIMDETGKVYDAVRAAIPTLKPTPQLSEAISGIGAKRRNNPYLKETPSVAKLRTRLANAGEADVGQVLDAIEEYRADARLLSQNAEKPEAIQRAKASREAADVLENALDEAISQAGRPDLIPSLKNARMKRAKAHQAEEATSGKKRPGVALMDMKLAGEKLSGEMELAADVHRDLSPNGPLSVNKAAGGGNTPGVIQETLQGVTRPILQPMLNSEMGQRAMFGPRVPESLAPYEPRQFDVPEPAPIQGGMFGGPLEFEPPGGRAGGQLPSDTRRLNSTVGPQAEALGPLLDLEGTGGLPGQMPSDARRLASTSDWQNQIRMQDFELAPPEGQVGPIIERRADIPESAYTGIERRVNGVPDLTAERQRVLDRPIGTRPNAGIADALLEDTGIRRAVRADTLAGREALNPGDQLPVGGIEPGTVPGPIVPETGEFQRAGRGEPPMTGFGPVRSNAGIGEMIGNERVRPGEGTVSFTKEDLFALGFSAEEIAQLLGEG